MEFSERGKAAIGYFLLFGLGAAFLAFHVAHGLAEDETVQTFLFGVLLPSALTVALLGGGVWLWRSDHDGEQVLRVGAWCVVGTAVLTIGVVLLVLYEQAHGVQMDDVPFFVANAASGGAVFGFIVGVYSAAQHAAQARAERLSRQLTVLNRVLRHDLRNKATVIQGQAEWLSTDGGDDHERLQTIQDKTAELVEIGEQARQVERLLRGDDSGQDLLDLTAVVDECIDQVDRDYPGVEITTSLPAELPVRAHPLIGSAIANVIENAAEHNDKASPRIEVDLTDAGEDDEYVDLRIADNGPGIADSEVTVLERGYETPLEHTSGLGLWIANWIVFASGGEIEYESNDPGGSVVTLRFETAGAAGERVDTPEP